MPNKMEVKEEDMAASGASAEAMKQEMSNPPKKYGKATRQERSGTQNATMTAAEASDTGASEKDEEGMLTGQIKCTYQAFFSMYKSSLIYKVLKPYSHRIHPRSTPSLHILYLYVSMPSL